MRQNSAWVIPVQVLFVPVCWRDACRNWGHAILEPERQISVRFCA